MGDVNTETAAQKFYEPVSEDIYRSRDNDLLTVLGYDGAQRAQRAQEFTAMVRDTGMAGHHTIASLLYNAGVDAEIAAARGTEEPDDHRLSEHARTVLADKYGLVEAEALLARAVKFGGSHPTLKKLLNTRGIGSRPDVVEALVDFVRTKNFR
jgi:hypothetical protein